MARPRTAPQMRSAAAHLLDDDAFGDATTPKPGAVLAAAPRPTTKFRKRQVILDDTAHDRLERLTAALRRSTGTRLTTSHAMRALLSLTDAAISALAITTPPPQAMHLPNNAPRFDGERRQFEHALAGMIRAAWPPAHR